MRSFVPRILATGDEGHVVNITSMAALRASGGIGPYTVAKHGVLGLLMTGGPSPGPAHPHTAISKVIDSCALESPPTQTSKVEGSVTQSRVAAFQ